LWIDEINPLTPTKKFAPDDSQGIFYATVNQVENLSEQRHEKSSGGCKPTGQTTLSTPHFVDR